MRLRRLRTIVSRLRMLHREIDGNGAASGRTSMTTLRGYEKYFLSSCVSCRPKMQAAVMQTTHQKTRPVIECARIAFGTPCIEVLPPNLWTIATKDFRLTSSSTASSSDDGCRSWCCCGCWWWRRRWQWCVSVSYLVIISFPLMIGL